MQLHKTGCRTRAADELCNIIIRRNTLVIINNTFLIVMNYIFSLSSKFLYISACTKRRKKGYDDLAFGVPHKNK